MSAPARTGQYCSLYVRLFSVAAVEWRSIVRSHPFRIFVPAAALLLLLAPTLVVFAFHHKAELVLQVGLSTAGLFAVVLGLLAGAATLARERIDGLRDLLLARPLGPGALVGGKWLGIGAAVTLSVAVLGAVHAANLAARGIAIDPGSYLAALLVAISHGLLAAAVALTASAVLRPGPAFLAALLFLLSGHAVALLGEGTTPEVLRFLLPRTPHLNLAGEAAFGPFPAALWLLAFLHGLLYSAFLLTLAAPLSRSRGRG